MKRDANGLRFSKVPAYYFPGYGWVAYLPQRTAGQKAEYHPVVLLEFEAPFRRQKPLPPGSAPTSSHAAKLLIDELGSPDSLKET